LQLLKRLFAYLGMLSVFRKLHKNHLRLQVTLQHLMCTYWLSVLQEAAEELIPHLEVILQHLMCAYGKYQVIQNIIILFCECTKCYYSIPLVCQLSYSYF
jgi:hypothetical protein